MKMRGQAFLVFREQEMADRALHDLQSFVFFGKEMRISYARTLSDVTTTARGLYEKRVQKERNKRRRENLEAARARKRDQVTNSIRNLKKRTGGGDAEGEDEEDSSSEEKATEERGEKNQTLFVEGLTEDTTQEMLQKLFGQYRGLEEVRYIESRRVAFVQYENEKCAKAAKFGLDNFRLKREHKIRVSYAVQ